MKNCNGGKKNIEGECAVDGLWFLKLVARTKIVNFAAENVKESKTAVQKINAAEGVRDAFGQMSAVVAKFKQCT